MLIFSLKNVIHKRFVVQYKNGFGTRQPVGKFTQIIAIHIMLKSPDPYNGHCLRQSSTSLLAEEGVDIITINRHEVENKRKIATQI